MIKVLRNQNNYFIGEENGKRLTPDYLFIDTFNLCKDLYVANCIAENVVTHYVYNAANGVIIEMGISYNYIGYCDTIFAFCYYGSWHYFDANLTLLHESKEMVRYIPLKAWKACFVAKGDDGEYLYDYEFNKLAGPYDTISDMDDFGTVLVSKKDGDNIKYSALVVLSSKTLIFDIPDRYERVEMFELHRFKTFVGDKCGIVSIEGKEILPCEYDDITYRQGIETIGIKSCYILENNDKYGLATVGGEVILKCEYDRIDVSTDPFFPKAMKIEADGTIVRETVNF